MWTRLGENLASLLFLIAIVFFMIHLVPGDPAQIALGEKARPENIEKIRKDWGLDQALYIQLGKYFARLAKADLGTSIRSSQSVFEELKARFPATLELSFLAMFLAIVLGILLGAFAARKPGSWTDLFLSGFSVVGMSFPIFFIGLIFILIFGKYLNWFPLSGRIGYEVFYQPTTGFVLIDSLLAGRGDWFKSGIHHLILPALTLATVPLSLIARLTRSCLMECLQADYIRTARAKGQKEKWIFFKHALRNALLPVTTMIGFQFGLLMGGAILTENVFAWPGLGRWMVFAVEGRDYPVVQASILFFGISILLVMLLTELLQARLDPRWRRS